MPWIPLPPPPSVGICGLTLKSSLGRFCSIPPSLSIFFLSFLPLSLSTYFSLSSEPLFVSVCVCLPTCPPAPPVSLKTSLSLILLDTELKMFSGKVVNKASHSKNDRRQTSKRQCVLNQQPCVQGNVRGNHGFCLEHPCLDSVLTIPSTKSISVHFALCLYSAFHAQDHEVMNSALVSGFPPPPQQQSAARI